MVYKSAYILYKLINKGNFLHIITDIYNVLNTILRGLIMSSIINSVYTPKSNSFLKSSDEEEHKEKKKKIVTERQGNYYCTYIVDDKGQKILLKRIPAKQVEEKNNLGTQGNPIYAKLRDYSAVQNARTDFECKQKMNIEASHKENLHKIMNILKEYSGVPTDSNKSYDYKF